MPPTMHELGIDRLNVEDRIALAQEIWDSVAQEVEQSPLTEAQRQELERRLADSIAGGPGCSPTGAAQPREVSGNVGRPSP